MAQYDAFAGEFEAHAAESPYNAFYDRPAVLEALGDVSGRTILDAGCGPGFYAAELARRGANVIGFDQSSEMVALARRRLGADAELRVHDLTDPIDWLESDAVDLVLMALVLHHLEDPVPALRELHRVLTTQGRLVISTIHPTFDWRNLGGSYFDEEVVEETWRGSWRVRYMRKPLTAWCADMFAAGFVIEDLVEPRPVPAMQERYPQVYERLTAEPAFITFMLRKAIS
jgi:SAM-dependent methyltransferase